MKIGIKDLYYVLLFLAFLPSGSLCGVPIKEGLVIILLIYSLTKKTIYLSKPTKAILFSLVMMIPWGILSIYNGYSDGMLSFLKSFLTFFLMMMVTYRYIDNGWMDYERAYNSIKGAAFVLMSAKIFAEVLLLAHVISYSSVFWVFEKVFNTAWMPLVGSLSIYRITIPNDSLPLIIIGLVILREKDMSFIKKYIIVLLGLFYTAITFSRVTIIEYIAIILVTFFLFMSEDKTIKGRITFITLLAFVACVVIYVLSNETIMELIIERFATTYSNNSDSFRYIQFKYLKKGYLESPFWGNGLGAYVRDCIRSYDSLHSYELEWVALFYQLGIIGVVCVIGSLLYSIIVSVFKGIKDRNVKIYLFVVFIIWLAKPLYNPNMFSAHSAVIISLLIIASNVYGNKNKNDMK